MKTAEEIKKEITERILSREYGSWESIANDAYDEGYVQGLAASHPPAAPVSGEELTDVSYYKGVLTGLSICNKMYGEGTLNNLTIHENEVYYRELIENENLSASLPTREQGERKFSQSEIGALQSSIYKITGKGEVMALFNKMLGVNAG